MEVEMMKALGMAGGFMAAALGSMGSSLGTGTAGASAVGAWKKCYQQDKPAPFLLTALAGIPLSQTIYGMVAMLLIVGKAQAMPQYWALFLLVGFFCGWAQFFSAWYQGKVAAGSCNAFGETNQGFANYIMALGIVETCALFALIFTILVMPKEVAPAVAEAAAEAVKSVAQ